MNIIRSEGRSEGMINRKQIAASLTIAVILAIFMTVFIAKVRKQGGRGTGYVLTGAVITADVDPRKQVPIANAEVTALGSSPLVKTMSDPAGLFRLSLPAGWRPEQAFTLEVQSPNYKPFEMTAHVDDRIYLARLDPIPVGSPRNIPKETLTNVRIRYSVKATTTSSIGSLAEPFRVANTGNLPCQEKLPCSPDRKWKATVSTAHFDAGSGNQFVDTRVSCIAGPCPFTKVEEKQLTNNNRNLSVSVLNWSDTATYLVEAEVNQTKIIDVIRQAYATIFGLTINFTLPATAEGPSLEADLNGTGIVFPFGPDLIVSWGTCSYKAVTDGTQVYRCDLKPGYRFQ